MGQGPGPALSALFLMRRFTARNPGATLVELVTVVLLLGIIAAIAAPRFFGRSEFDERGYFDEVLAAVRYAQKLAIASGCDVRVSISAGGYALDEWLNPGVSCAAGSGGIVAVNRPGGGSFTAAPPAGVVLGGSGLPALFYFDGIGRPRDAAVPPGALLGAPVDITIGPRTLSIEPETGYSRCSAGC